MQCDDNNQFNSSISCIETWNNLKNIKKRVEMPQDPIHEEIKENINETDENTIENKDENATVIVSIPETIYENNDKNNGKKNDKNNNSLIGHKRPNPSEIENEGEISPSPPAPVQKQQKRQIVEKGSNTNNLPPIRMRRLSHVELSNDIMVMDNNNNNNENESINSFIEHRNNSELINKMHQILIFVIYI
eukprot:444066_1